MIISSASLKGGVGKTSLTYHAAGALARLGRRVLVVDNDPQGSITSGFLGVEVMAGLPEQSTIAAVYGGCDPYPETVIRPAGFGIDLVPGSRHVTRFNVPVPEEAPYEQQVCLREFLSGVSRLAYDVILIDNPPNLHLCTYASLAASDCYLVPVQPEDFGSQGLAAVSQSASLVRSQINPGLRRLGIVMTMVAARRAVHRLYETRLRAGYGAEVFAAGMPEAVDYVEAVVGHRPVAFHKPKGAAARAMHAIAEEMIARLEQREAA